MGRQTSDNLASEPAARRSSRWLVLLGVVVALGTMALGVLVLLDARRDAWRQADQAARNLLLALERDIARNIATLDLSLRGVMEALAEPDLDKAGPRVRHQALFDRAASAEDLGSILVLDANGSVVEDSTALQPHQLQLGDRDYLRVHQERPDAGLFLSRPYRSRLGGGDPRIAISRRLQGPDGAFAGVVMGALRVNYFRRLFEALDLGPGGTITLVRTDGRIIARHPFNDADIDRDLSGRDVFQRLAAAPNGQFAGRASIDGVERLYTFQRVGALPLILSVNMAVDDIYAPWRRKAAVIGPALGLLCAAAIALCLLLRREMDRRAGAERALARAAATDALTGVANRRAFEGALDREWRRAARAREVVGLLMIDVDHFKTYNDRHGHQAGDRALRAVAEALAAALRRPADLAARYGGEEFAALLPATDHAGALAVAEEVRRAIAALDLPHMDSPFGRVTVSVGAASLRARRPDGSDALIGAADAALYDAKRQGRDRVVAAGKGPTEVMRLAV